MANRSAMSVLDEEVFENRRRYENRRELYRSFGYDIEREREFILGIVRPVTGPVLEIGTGKGYMTVAIARAGYRLTSVDLSVEDQRMALLNLRYDGCADRATLEIADAEHLPYVSASFDLVITVNVLHHLARPRDVYEEMTRVMASSGRIVVSDFSTYGLEVMDRILQSEGRRHDVGSGSLMEMREWLLADGFKVGLHRTRIQDTIVGVR
ncbi:MAG TPA: class I SAM-dependent methyltransferase [Candidatus Ozemobacteraceae bacterium]|nr:class I SAM-dependent methyltransferase [Candidatus Ozemobacteraceae bacterium]